MFNSLQHFQFCCVRLSLGILFFFLFELTRNRNNLLYTFAKHVLGFNTNVSSNPVRGMPLFSKSRSFTYIAQYLLAPGTDLRVCL
jgi:hypothetical protein